MRAFIFRKSVGVGLAAVVITAVLTSTAAVLPSGMPGAAPLAAASCPQVQVVFARGRMESPGTGVL
ncbi:MAG: cutinase family protein, partial [Mycobacterium sp.]